MGKPRGRRTAGIAAVLGVLTIGGAAIALRERAIEEWNLRKLEWGSVEEKREAIQRLAAIGSARAARQIVEFAWAPEPGSDTGACEALKTCGRPIDPRAFELLTEHLDDIGSAFWMPAFGLFGSIGPPAAPALAEVLRGGRTWRSRFLAAVLLGRNGQDAAVAVPALRDGLRHDCVAVRVISARMLARYGPGAPTLEEVLRSESARDGQAVHSASPIEILPVSERVAILETAKMKTRTMGGVGPTKLELELQTLVKEIERTATVLFPSYDVKILLPLMNRGASGPDSALGIFLACAGCDLDIGEKLQLNEVVRSFRVFHDLLGQEL